LDSDGPWCGAGDVFRLVLTQGVGLVAIGIGFGLVGALATGRALASVLYGVGAVDVIALGVAIVSLAIVALLACYVPARRATHVDPMVALRDE
jgi:putative ABC transport system permease protein